MANKSRMFRSSMSGFNKEDVNKYIIDMNNEFTAKEEEYKCEINSLKQRLAVSAERLNEAATSLETVSETKEQLKAAEDMLTSEKEAREAAEKGRIDAESRLSEAQAKLEELMTKLAETESALSSVKKELSEIPPVLATEGNINVLDNSETDSDKIRLYDELRGNIGDIIINANKNADDIVKEAEKKASAIADTSREKAEAAKRKLTVVTGRTIASLKKNAILNADSCVREFRAYSEDISHSSRAMTINLEKKYAELASKMETLGNELEEGIKSVLRDFDKSCNSIKVGLTSETDKQ